MYQDMIRNALQATRDLRLMVVDPNQVEAFMRLEHSTLDGLSPRQFDSEAVLGAHCVIADPNLARELAGTL